MSKKKSDNTVYHSTQHVSQEDILPGGSFMQYLLSCRLPFCHKNSARLKFNFIV